MQDLFHSTFFTLSPVIELPNVVTFHDMIPESLPYICSHAALVDQVERKRAALAAANWIITISGATASELQMYHPETADRTTIIHLGAEHLPSHERGSANAARLPDGCDYCLFVGERFVYKNFAAVAQAMAVEAWPRDLKLVVAGPQLTKIEIVYFRRLGVADRIIEAGWVSDAKLNSLYRGASCFIYPSLMEGFGLPLIEAQNVGCPVVCADIPCFREVVMQSALLFPPNSPSDLAGAVRQSTLPPIRRRLQEAGYENVKRFSWDRAAEQLSEVYRRVHRNAG